jgi:plastocyanin
MRRNVLVLIATAALAVGLAACGSSSKSSTPAASNSSGAQITIDNSPGFTFHPTPVRAGSTVTVKNNTQATHTVTQDGGGFDVTVDAGKTATFTAPAAAGTYKFHCNIHTFMKATLTVT